VLIQPACEEAHDGDAEVDDAAQDAQFELVHAEVIYQLSGACWQDAVIEVY
jgi:hypothetical protein